FFTSPFADEGDPVRLTALEFIFFVLVGGPSLFAACKARLLLSALVVAAAVVLAFLGFGDALPQLGARGTQAEAGAFLAGFWTTLLGTPIVAWRALAHVVRRR